MTDPTLADPIQLDPDDEQWAVEWAREQRRRSGAIAAACFFGIGLVALVTLFMVTLGMIVVANP